MTGRRSGLTVLAALALVAGGALGQQQPRPPVDGHEFVAEAEWGKFTGKAGKRVYVESRWKDIFGTKITLLPALASTGAFVVTDQSQLHKDLVKTARPTVEGGQLEEGVSNVRLFGTVQAAGAGKGTLVVSRVVKLEDDLVRFRREVGALAPNDAEGRMRIAQQARAIAQRFGDAQLLQFANQLEGVALQLLLAQARTPAERLALAERLKDRDERQQAVIVFGQVQLDQGATDAQRAQARTRLGELDATYVGDRWITFEEFKASEGFIRRQAADGSQRWIRRELAELEDEVAKLRDRAKNNVLIIRENPIQCGRDAQSSKLRVGQFMEEAREAAGQPVRVRHLQGEGIDAGKQADWVQWEFADGRRAYFIQPLDDPEPGLLFEWKAANIPLPDK